MEFEFERQEDGSYTLNGENLDLGNESTDDDGGTAEFHQRGFADALVPGPLGVADVGIGIAFGSIATGLVQQLLGGIVGNGGNGGIGGLFGGDIGALLLKLGTAWAIGANMKGNIAKATALTITIDALSDIIEPIVGDLAGNIFGGAQPSTPMIADARWEQDAHAAFLNWQR